MRPFGEFGLGLAVASGLFVLSATLFGDHFLLLVLVTALVAVIGLAAVRNAQDWTWLAIGLICASSAGLGILGLLTFVGGSANFE